MMTTTEMSESIDFAARRTRGAAKMLARQLVAAGRVMEAVLVLTSFGYQLCDALVEVAPLPTANVGDILYSSWGYEQSNVDFYQVVAVKGSMITVREIGATIVSATRGSDMVAAKPDTFIGPEMKKRVKKCYGDTGYAITIESYADAYLWDGTPRHQTGTGFGH